MEASYRYILALLSGIVSFGLLVFEVPFYKDGTQKLENFRRMQMI